MNKTIVVMFSAEDVRFESQHVDCDLKNGVYSYTDSMSEHHDIFVTDVDVSKEMLEAMRQYYYHVKCNCNFIIPTSHLIERNEQNQQQYLYRDEMLNRFLLSTDKNYKSLDGFDYETHKHLKNQY